MPDTRKPLEINSELIFSGTVYKITKVLGKGSNAICYRAEYPDDTSPNKKYGVLIKELFPLNENGLIKRVNGKDIHIDDGAHEIFELHKKSFLRGRDISIKLSEDFPDKTMMVINSFKANGTFYLIIIISGGYSFAGYTCKTLKEAVGYISGSLRALRHFHSTGLLHLDISPDNILVFSKEKSETDQRAALIDYNSVFSLDEINIGAADYLSIKKPFTAPEIILENFKSVGFHTDLYSVTAIFARLLCPGLAENKTIERKDISKISSELEIFENTPVTAVHKTIAILKKGLNSLIKNRYANIDEYLEDLMELNDRIENIGITIPALWEVSAATYKDMVNATQNYKYLSDNAIPSQIDYKSIENDNKVFISGEGGMGKTTVLLRIWKELTAEFDLCKPVPIYIKLNDYDKSKSLISRCLRKLKFNDKTLTTGEAQGVLTSILEDEKSSNRSVLFLLDGFNEVQESQKSYLKAEIEKICEYKNAAVIVTSRISESLSNFKEIIINPLADDTVQVYLNLRKLIYPDNSDMQILLRNPMLLSIYTQITEKTGDNAKIYTESNTLIKIYADYLCSTLSEQDKYAAHYAVEIILPQIAGYMLKSQAHTISLRELDIIIEKNYKIIQYRAFRKVFVEYVGMTGKIIGEAKSADDFFKRIIIDVLYSKLALIFPTEDGQYGFSHQIFRDYYFAFYKKVKKKLDLIRFLLLTPKVIIALLLTVAVFIPAGLNIINQNTPPTPTSETASLFPNPNDEDEVKNVQKVLEHIGNSVQSFVLKYNERKKLFKIFNLTLNADEYKYNENFDNLQKEVERQQKYFDIVIPVSLERFEEYIDKLPENKTALINTLTELFNFATEFEEKDNQIVSGLINILDPEENASKLVLPEDKPEAVEYYRQWLENQVNQSAAMLNYILSSIPSSYQIELFQKADLSVVGQRALNMVWSSYTDFEANIIPLRDNKNGGERDILNNLRIRGVNVE